MAHGNSGGPSEEAVQRRARLDLEFDETKLQGAVASGQGDVFVLQWLARTEAALKVIDTASLQPLRVKLEATLLRFLPATPPPSNDPSSPPSTPTVRPSSNFPKPGRPVRHLLARCLVLLLARSEGRSLFDVLQALLRTAGDETKGHTPDKETKAAALYIAGEIFAALGQDVMSLFLDLSALTQKIFRNSSNAVLLRYHALMCLARALGAGAKSLNDQPGKEMVKNLRGWLSDRSGAVVQGCAECLLIISQKTDFLAARSEITLVLAAAFKALDSADFVTKRSLSRLCAGLLASTQKENSAPPPEPKKKDKKKKKGDAGAGEDDSDDDGAPPVSVDAAASRTLLKASEMLDELARPFVSANTSRKGKAGILDIYATLFATLGADWVLNNYGLVLRHLIDELPNAPRAVPLNRADVLWIRTGVSLILRRVIGDRMLGEPAQVAAIQEICSSYLKRWPVLMPGNVPPTKYTLVLALNEVSGLLQQLGSCPAQVHDALFDPLLRCLSHPSNSVQVGAAWCLRTLCAVNPSLLASTIEAAIVLLQKDLKALDAAGQRPGHELTLRTGGHARGIAALINVVPTRPLYVSFEISTRVFNLATELLRRSADHPLPVSATEIQVAWVLLGALMSLGKGFVRLHLPQLLNLWRNALPKPAAKDTAAGPSSRSDAEWAFLLHVRECALGAMYSFLDHNAAALLTNDSSRKLVACLTHALAFVNGFAAQHPYLAQEQVPGAERSSLTLLDREHMVRRRVFQCFKSLAASPSAHAALDAVADGLVQSAVQTFAEPDRYVGSAAQAVIAASAGNFTNVWGLCDGYAFGLNSLQRDEECFVGAESGFASYPAMQHPARTDLLNRDAVEVQLDALQRRPILGAPEHDPLILYARANAPRAEQDTASVAPLPPPPVTAMVDAAIELFAAIYPFQAREIQISSVETLLGHCRSSRLEKNPGRRQAVQLNAAACLLGALRVATNQSLRASRRPAGFNNDRLTQALREILKDALLSSDAPLRASAAEAYGRLAAVAGSHAMSAQVQFLVDQVVNNRDPGARAGCARAFGCVYSEVGGLSAGPLTKTIVNILMSLSSDPHPTVHHSAMEALRMVVEAASLSYSAYVSSTLGMLVKLYMLDTHEPEGGSAGSSNLRADLPAHQSACRIISALIGVLGPDLLDSQKVRDLILTLLHEFGQEQSDPGVVVEATKAKQHFALFASQHMDLTAWILELKGHLQSSQRPRKLAAINSFYQLIQRQALVVSRVGGDALVEDLFAQLDDDPTIDGVREVLLGWLHQTAELSPDSWINLCQRIMSRAVAGDVQAPAKKAQQPGMFQDEEAAGINAEADVSATSTALSQSRWRTQLFALQCLHEVFLTVRRSGRLEHFDTPRATAAPVAGQAPANQPASRVLMSSRVADLIKMAFIASTSATSAIRLEGLTVLRDVIQYFKATRDPDFEESLLLEQHQAPIAAALTPAFTSDSTPEVLAAAVQVCATFVGSGVVREVARMGRILRLLATSLEKCKVPEMDSLGEVPHLSPNAATTLKNATLSAWSELQISALQQPYLRDVIEPHIPTLAPYWIASLRDYAQMRTDPEAAVLAMPQPGPPLNARLDQEYAGLTQEVLLPHYDQAWHKILHAVTVLADQANSPVLLALNGETNLDGQTEAMPELSPYRDSPAANFHPLFGLSVEALSSSGNVPSSSATAPFVELSREAQRSRVALYALRTFSKAQFAGPALLDASIFEEVRNLYMRLVMTEPLPIQLNVVEVVLSMVNSYQGRLLDVEPVAGEALSSEAKLTQCLQVITRVVTHSYLLPGTADDKVALLRAAYAAFLATASHFLHGQQESLLVVALSAYSELLHDERQELDLVGPTLPCLKAICERVALVTQATGDVLERAVHGFLCAALNNVDELRARAGAIIDIKTRNSLLVLTVALTSLPASLRISTGVIEHFCFLLAQKFKSDADKSIGLTAVNCARSMLLSSTRGGASCQYAAGLLLPALVEFVATESARLGQLGDVKEAEPPLQLVEEAVKALVGFALTATGAYRSQILAIVMPTVILALSPEEPKGLHNAAVAQLLAVATQAGAAFKEVTALLDSEQRIALETSIRNALAKTSTANARASQQSAPQKSEAKIALRSFG